MPHLSGRFLHALGRLELIIMRLASTRPSPWCCGKGIPRVNGGALFRADRESSLHGPWPTRMIELVTSLQEDSDKKDRLSRAGGGLQNVYSENKFQHCQSLSWLSKYAPYTALWGWESSAFPSPMEDITMHRFSIEKTRETFSASSSWLEQVLPASAIASRAREEVGAITHSISFEQGLQVHGQE